MKIYQADAFTDRPFAGNPAAVCLLEQPRDSSWMQSIALEMNLSETAFLIPKGPNHYDLRWFTPGSEVDLCGHATLASAHILWENGLASHQALAFDTLSGRLSAKKEGDWIELDFPAVSAEEIEIDPEVARALGGKVIWMGLNKFDLLVELSSAQDVLSLEPDFRFLKKLPYRGFIVTAKSEESGYHFISRFFAPAVGVDEDPVTGSAHCCLSPYWSNKTGQPKLTGFQASPRGGLVQVCLEGNRVLLRGKAITILRGELLV